MALVRWTPTRDLFDLTEEFSRMLDRFFGPVMGEETEMPTPTTWYPMVDIAEKKDAFVVTAELPGMKKEDIHITFKDGTLSIEGERKRESEVKGVDYHRVERRYGKFCRTFQIPVSVKEDKIQAAYKDGILTIQLPKAEEAKPKEISVKVS